MALITCPECGKEISDSAVACPNCGFGIAALKDRNIAQVKVSLCANNSLSDWEIAIYNTKTRSLVYAKVSRGGIARFEITEDTEIGINYVPDYEKGKRPALTKIVSPGKKYQVFWGGNSDFLKWPLFGSCQEVEEFSDTVSGLDPNKEPPKWFATWNF
ncbi:MAG: zinc-ribbon domain-containing protein [Oscillibacter sp.]|jgi:DNA-directed RNA polymerase subunit RPC12/RpoP|nr:zinc-ribbon domain-containing protein [Oscillibacter sp.]